MKRLVLTFSAALLAVSIMAAPAQAAFGIKDFDMTFVNADGSSASQAGSHPFALRTTVAVNTVPHPEYGETIDEALKDLKVSLPPGLIGSTLVLARCSNADFTTIVSNRSSCADDTAIGVAELRLGYTAPGWSDVPVYNLEPPPGVPVKLGFVVASAVPVTIEAGVSEEPPYELYSRLTNISQATQFFEGTLTLWGTPADDAHDPFRGSCLEEEDPVPGQFSSKGKCTLSVPPQPFLTLPRACEGPLETLYEARSWQSPSQWVTGSVQTHDNAEPPNPLGFTGCGKLGFAPRIESLPTSASAESGSGLDFNLDFDDEGLTNPDGLAQSDVKRAEVTLPRGVTINPSVGEGLAVCTPSDLDRETLRSAPGVGCPNPSKLGSLEVRSPLVDEAVEGSIFLAPQDDPKTAKPGAENPFDTLIALYFVLKNAELGVNIKLPVKVEPDPNTGQLVATLQDNPQLPFSHFNAHLRTGARAALITPSACGTYTTTAKLTPWANPEHPVTTTASFKVTSGVAGGPCPSGGIPPFDPRFEAGAINNNAGSFSPFNMRLTRKDGEQDMTKFSSVLPPGELGSLKGVDKCPDAAVAIAKAKSGTDELQSPSCPLNSQIGRTLAGAGVGEALTYVGGQLYLAGPYKGAPLSVIAITPAVAGPFDAGTVVVRLGLTLNPKTAEVEVDGAASDPIPHILKGIVLKVRDLRVYVDRPNFTLNPTNCEESSAKATLFGSFLDVFSPADDRPAQLSTRYQAANCLNLGFKPKLALNLKGGTKRGGHPGLLATYSPRPGDANLEGMVVRLPRSAFLDQAHIRTICTRVQFAAKACPPAAQYGFIRAWTPLLDEPLQGPVWLRSSNHKLPDLVFDLHGIVDIEVATRIDSAGGGIRATLEELPDAPLSKVVLRMQGGQKGLIVNSRNLCGKRARANVEMEGQNGKGQAIRPVMRARCGKQRQPKRRHG